MAFYKAKKNFEDNIRRISPDSDPVMWNLNAGLLNLVQGLTSRISDIEQKLQNLEQTLRYVQNDVTQLRR